MMKNFFLWLLLFTPSIGLFLPGCSSNEAGSIKSTGPEVVSFRVLPFNINEIKLLDGPFLHATEKDTKTLLNYEPDRLLSRFYSENGLKPKADQYMGWENETLAGHSLGHYLSACSMMYLTTGDSRFADRVNYIIDELKFIQDEVGNGYIGAFPKGKLIFEEEVAKGDIRSKGFDLNGIWAPYYTQHKMMAGLRDGYRLCGNTVALEVEKRFTDWLDGIVTPLTMNRYRKCFAANMGG